MENRYLKSGKEIGRHEPIACPWGCGKNLDAFSWIGESAVAPSKGDLSVCIYCGKWMEFAEKDNKLTLIKAPVSTIIHLPEDILDVLIIASDSIKQFKEQEKEREHAG